MAVDSYDPTTGRPIFNAGGAPDLGVDETAVGIYAADVGNRIVRANLAALDAYTYKRAGLGGHALDTRTDYVYNGTGWDLRTRDTGWITLGTLTTGWTIQSPDSLDYRVIGNILYLRGRVVGTTGASNTVLTTALPAAYRPAQDRGILIGDTAGTGNMRTCTVTSAGQIVIFKGAAAVAATPLDAVGPIPLG